MTMDIPEVFFDDADVLKSCALTTTAYGIAPLGLGTPLCESLYGYLLRLAMAHRVSSYNLLMELISGSKYRKRYAKYTTSRHPAWIEHYLLQMGSNTREFVEILSEATGVPALERCTLLPLANMFGPWRLIRRSRVFCPICVARRAFRHQREALASTVDCVGTCPIHGVVLRKTGCESKARAVLNERRPIYPGVCPDCGSVGHSCLPMSARRALQTDIWVSRQVGLVIAMSSSGRRFSRGDLLEALNEVTKQSYGGNFSRFARSAGIPKATLHLWMHKESIPNLSQLLALCNAAEVSLARLLCGEVVSFEAPRVKLQSKPLRRTCLVGILDKLEAAIKVELRSFPAKSLTRVARSFGIDRDTIKNHFPSLARRLVQRAAAHRRKQLNRSRLKVRQAVRVAGEMLLSRGDRLSRRNFARLLKYQFFHDSTTAAEIRSFKHRRAA